MTKADKRARKKANKLKGWPEVPGDFVEVGPPEANEEQEMKLTPREAVQLEEALEEPVTTESEHAAAMTALAAAKRMRNRKVSE